MGITADNNANLAAANLQYGNGSLLNDDGHVNLETARYYQRLYGEAWIDLCERSLVRMKKQHLTQQQATATSNNGNAKEQDDSNKRTGVGSLIGISSPGCNLLQPVNKGYSMPGTGMCNL